LKSVLIRAPEKDPDELRGPAWMPPENPMSGTLDKAKNFINNIKAKLAKRESEILFLCSVVEEQFILEDF
jgi:hypothetical protein